MAGVAWLKCYLVFIVTVNGGYAVDLRETFYNQVRDLLRYNSFQDKPGAFQKPIEVKEWGAKLEGKLGQVSGISVNLEGQPVIFHRAKRVWDYNTFNDTHYYTKLDQGAIQEDTILTLDPETGDIIDSWGKNIFYLPHGITIDHRGNTWVTDVAMHQVLKFPKGSRKPTLRLGKLFSPGHGKSKLCKPTSVAIASSGQIFVADGYCNSRILKFSHKGILLRVFPQYEEFLSLIVPHSLALIERKDLLCVADRENMRVACFKAELTFTDQMSNKALSPFTIHQPDLGRVFGIAAKGEIVYAVNGPTSSHIPIQGFTIDPIGEQILDHWLPSSHGFTNPHDIAISPYGEALYVSEIGPNKVWKFKLTYNNSISE